MVIRIPSYVIVYGSAEVSDFLIIGLGELSSQWTLHSLDNNKKLLLIYDFLYPNVFFFFFCKFFIKIIF